MSVPTADTQVDPLLSVGDSVHPFVDDVHSQMTGLHGEGMSTTSHGVKISFGQPPKRRKTIDESAPTSKAKTQASLGMTKSRTARAREYMTRSSMTFKSKYFGNDKDPIDID